jgi:hypothetical protein
MSRADLVRAARRAPAARGAAIGVVAADRDAPAPHRPLQEASRLVFVYLAQSKPKRCGGRRRGGGGARSALRHAPARVSTSARRF